MLCVFIPPNCSDSIFDVTLQCLDSLSDNSDLLILGDFNAPDADWDSLTASSRRSAVICDFVFDKSLVQLLDSPTHHLGNILDLVLTNAPDRFSEINIQQVSFSDHHLVKFTLLSRTNHLRCSTSTPSPNLLGRIYSMADWVSIDSYLMEVDFVALAMDVDSLYASICRVIKDACDIIIHPSVWHI